MKLETDNRRLVPSSLYPLTIVLTELVLVFHNFSLAYNIGLNRPHRQLKMSTAYAVKRAVGKLVPSQTAFLLCDVQERFVPLIHKSSTVVHTTRLLTSVSKELSIPLVVTEQYKKVFGPTHGQCFNEPLTEESNIPIFEKKIVLNDYTRSSTASPKSGQTVRSFSQKLWSYHLHGAFWHRSSRMRPSDLFRFIGDEY